MNYEKFTPALIKMKLQPGGLALKLREVLLQLRTWRATLGISSNGNDTSVCKCDLDV
jgi:hypothetical protein